MQGKKCFGTRDLRREVLGYGRCAAALLIVMGALAWAKGAAASTCKAIHVFTGTAGGASPSGNLTFDAAGNLYGTTSGGGSGCNGTGCGVVYQLTPNSKGTWTYRVLHKFTGMDGANPQAGVIFDRAGNLYGTTSAGGLNESGCGIFGPGCGVVFKLGPNPNGTFTESVIYTFKGGADGAGPLAGLIFDAAGNLYGATWEGGFGSGCSAAGCGTVFELRPNSDGTWTESVIHSFQGGMEDAVNPLAGLILDAAGNLYGAAGEGGGTYQDGIVFKLKPNLDGTWTESVLHSFTGADGAVPGLSLTSDTAGNLYGTTDDGGTACFYACGVVFKLAPNPDGTWSESVLQSFARGADGGEPQAGLVIDAAGNLYGTASGGGADGYGVVFKLTPTASGWSETVLHSFRGFGEYPSAPAIFDPAGHLYGTTSSGKGNNGIVFEITP